MQLDHPGVWVAVACTFSVRGSTRPSEDMLAWPACCSTQSNPGCATSCGLLTELQPLHSDCDRPALCFCLQCGLARFPNNPTVLLVYANYIIHVKKEPRAARQQLQLAGRGEDASMFDKYAIFAGNVSSATATCFLWRGMMQHAEGQVLTRGLLHMCGCFEASVACQRWPVHVCLPHLRTKHPATVACADAAVQDVLKRNRDQSEAGLGETRRRAVHALLWALNLPRTAEVSVDSSCWLANHSSLHLM